MKNWPKWIENYYHCEEGLTPATEQAFTVEALDGNGIKVVMAPVQLSNCPVDTESTRPQIQNLRLPTPRLGSYSLDTGRG